MAQIRIPFADTQISTPNPGAGQVRAQLQPALRDQRAGQTPGDTGQRDTRAANIDPGLAGLKGRVEMQAAAEGGAAAIRAGAALDRMAESEQRLQDQTQISTSRVTFMRGLGEIELDMQGRNITSSGEARTEFAQRAGELRDRIGLDLGGRARDLWPSAADEMIVPREFNVARDAFQRGAQASIASLQDELRATANGAAASRNPVERAQMLASGEAAVQARVEAGVINPEVAGRLTRGFRSDVQMADVTRLMGQNPAAAIAMLNDQSATPDIEADRRASLINQALTRQDAMAARAEASAARAERRVERSLAEWDQLAAVGQVPAERAEATLALARGTPYEGAVRQRIADARTMAEFRLATPARQNELLTEAQARVTAGAATDRDLAHVQRMAQVQQQQRTGYAQDGWMQGVRDGIIDRSEIPPPLNLGDPASITARFNLSDRLSAARGYAVPVFSASEVQEFNRQFVAAQNNPALVAQITASINAIPDERIRTATYRQLEAARGDAGRMERGTLEIIGRSAAGSPAQQRAAVQMTQAVTTDRSERVRQIGESTELRAAMDGVMSTPEMRTIQATARVGRQQEVEFNAQLGIMRDLTAQHMAAGRTPTEAVRLAQDTVFADRATVYRPGLAQLSYDRSLNLGAPEAVERGLRSLRDQFAAGISVEPSQGADVAGRNREALRIAGQAEWVTVGPGRFALVARGDYQQTSVLTTITADQLRAATTGNVLQREEQASPRPAGQQRTGRVVPRVIEGFSAPQGSTETVRPSVQ